MPEPSDSTPDTLMLTALVATYNLLKSSKPEDRSERARRYAVTITKLEEVVSYFNTMVVEGFKG